MFLILHNDGDVSVHPSHLDRKCLRAENARSATSRALDDRCSPHEIFRIAAGIHAWATYAAVLWQHAANRAEEKP
jgi:hypothetical protein